jgi:hypothetical protein
MVLPRRERGVLLYLVICLFISLLHGFLPVLCSLKTSEITVEAVWKAVGSEMLDRRYYQKIDEKRPLELHHFDTSDSRRWSVDRKLQSRYYCRIRNCDDLLDIFNVSLSPSPHGFSDVN